MTPASTPFGAPRFGAPRFGIRHSPFGTAAPATDKSANPPPGQTTTRGTEMTINNNLMKRRNR
jgi:hypothetical protein